MDENVVINNDAISLSKQYCVTSQNRGIEWNASSHCPRYTSIEIYKPVNKIKIKLNLTIKLH